MKRFAFFLIFAPVCFLAIGQKIITDEVDAFTKAHLLETSMEKIAQKRDFMGDITARIELSVRSVNGEITIPCNISKTPMIKYDEESGIVFLFENGAIAFLKTMYTGIGSESKSMWGNNWFKTVLTVNSQDLDNLCHQKITAIRLQYFGGHQDFKIKGKESELIIKMMRLVMP